MLLTITTTHPPATDLGYLLHKHPGRCQTFDVGFGRVHVFYPLAQDDRCSASMLLDVDTTGLVKGRSETLAEYVNDRPYVASSLLSVAIGRVYGTALAGRCEARPELAATPIPVEASMPAVPAHGGPEIVARLFEPLGYEVHARAIPEDETRPDWGESHYLDLTLRGTVRLADLLGHLYVLIPVLDGQKHYWIGDAEVDKLLRHGGSWLPGHPDRELITSRYLRRRRSLIAAAVDRLVEQEGSDVDEAGSPAGEPAEPSAPTAASDDPVVRLHDLRIGAVVAALRSLGARSVLDLGCGEGRLLRELMSDGGFDRITGLDVSHRTLEIAQRRLQLDRLPPGARDRIMLLHGALTYRDSRLHGYDAAAVVEVIEHLDAPRIETFTRVLFGTTRPRAVVLTTPNREYNVRFAGLEPGALRHRDHRFEWTREEFHNWASAAAGTHGYTVRFLAVGEEDAEVGPPSQMAIFELEPETDP